MIVGMAFLRLSFLPLILGSYNASIDAGLSNGLFGTPGMMSGIVKSGVFCLAGASKNLPFPWS
jgi:hypothetical protein